MSWPRTFLCVDRDPDQRIHDRRRMRLFAMTRMPVRNYMHDSARWLKDVINWLCFGSMHRSTPMCEHYGHVFDRREWTELLPRCSDCGATITAASDLRRSNVNQPGDSSRAPGR
jgi:hypothetical protein